MSDNRIPAIEPALLGGYVGGMDFGDKPHGSLVLIVDEPFRAALGKRARVLIVPDESVYRNAAALADALKDMLAEAVKYEEGGSAYDRALLAAAAALRAAGRIP